MSATGGAVAEIASGFLDVISPASYASMGTAMASREEQQRQFDMNFWENKRRYGIELAMKEFALRHNMSMEQVQNMWQRNTGALSSIEQMRGATLQRRAAEKDLAERERKKRISREFMKGFNSMIRSGTKNQLLGSQ